MSSKTTPLHLPVLILLVVLLLSTMSDAQSPSDDGDAWVDNNNNVSPSMAIVVIVLVLGFFITGCIFIYIQQCTDTTSSSTVTPTTALMRNNNASPGLPQTIIETFPIFPFSDVKHHKIGKGALECAVCLSDFQDDDETLRLLPKCNHVFHSECIDTWLVAHTTCPVCRDNLAEVVPDSDDKLANSNSIHLTTDDVRVTITGRLPRSHSTGHSLNQLSEDHERFTLRIPAEVRRHIIDRTMMKRATSMVALPRQSSSRRGYRGGGGEGSGSGSSRYGRLFGRSFIMRVASLRSTAAAKVVAEGGGPTTEFKVGSTQLPV